MKELPPELDVSRETLDRLHQFEALLLKWTPKINLISRDTYGDVWTRHIVDSAQLFMLDQTFGRKWLDVGSGGGLPGVVAAILLAERAPDTQITMVESDQRKATFLRTALRECGVSGKVEAKRIESLPAHQAEVLTGRALAKIDALLGIADQHLVETGVALLHKGRNHQDEIDAARSHWHFDVIAHQSLTASDARILEIRNITRAHT